jgi:hypothetical protein
MDVLGFPLEMVTLEYECRRVREFLFVGGVVSPENHVPF